MGCHVALNAANARVFRLALDNRAPLVLIGNDGGLLESPTELTEIELGPAERLDLLVDFRGMSLEETTTLRCDRSGWDLLHFVVTRKVDDMPRFRHGFHPSRCSVHHPR